MFVVTSRRPPGRRAGEDMASGGARPSRARQGLESAHELQRLFSVFRPRARRGRMAVKELVRREVWSFLELGPDERYRVDVATHTVKLSRGDVAKPDVGAIGESTEPTFGPLKRLLEASGFGQELHDLNVVIGVGEIACLDGDLLLHRARQLRKRLHYVGDPET